MSSKRSHPTASFLVVLAMLLATSAWGQGEIAPGDLDPTFGDGGRVLTDWGGGGFVNDMAILPDEKIVVLGQKSITRYNKDGTLDESFGAGGRVAIAFDGLYDTAQVLALQTDGKIVVGAELLSSDFTKRSLAIARYNSDSTLDAGFADAGWFTSDLGAHIAVTDMVIDSQGRIIAVGAVGNTSPYDQASDIWVLRILVGGTLDDSFAEGGILIEDLGGRDFASGIIVQEPGPNLASMDFVNGIGFGIAGVSDTQIRANAEHDLPVEHHGYYRFRITFNMDTKAGILGVTEDGRRDFQFGKDGLAEIELEHPAQVEDMDIHLSGKIIASAGVLSNDWTQKALYMLCFNSDGSVNTAFGSTGSVLTAFSPKQVMSEVSAQPDGKSLLTWSGESDFIVARYLQDGSLDASFGMDGSAAISFADYRVTYLATTIVRDGWLYLGGYVSDKSNLSGSDTFLAKVFLGAEHYFTLSGTVFEDVNYGGGVGRSLEDSTPGVPRPGAKVELYQSDGYRSIFSSPVFIDHNDFIDHTTTDGNGKYAFEVIPGKYVVRVVNTSVTSSRSRITGATTDPVAVQTYRTDAQTGVALPVTNRVGGEAPSKRDAKQGAVGIVLATLSEQEQTPQSITSVHVRSDRDVNGVNFGFNFDTIVNTNGSGQGSLAQFIVNANTLSNENLAQENLPPSIDTSIFMIPPTDDPLGRPADLRCNDEGCHILTVTELPTVTDPARIDGATQYGYPQRQIAGMGIPIILLRPKHIPEPSDRTPRDGITIDAGHSTVQALVITGFLSGLRLSEGNDNTIKGCIIGTNGKSWSDLGNNIGILIVRSNNNTIGGSGSKRNVISGNLMEGIWISGGDENLILGNFLGTDVKGSAALGNKTGILIRDFSLNNKVGVSGGGNLISGNQVGIIIGGPNTKANEIRGNYIGTNPAGDNLGNVGDGSGSTESAAIIIRNGSAGTIIGGPDPLEGNTLRFNNGGDKPFVEEGATYVEAGNNIYGSNDPTPVP